MQRLSKIVVSSLAFAAVSMTMAQSPGPSPVLRFIREDIKPGKGAAHEKTEAAFVRAFSKADYAHYTALVATTGPSHALFMERYDSFAALEKAMASTEKEPVKSALDQAEAADGELRSGEREMIGTYRQELSYTPVPPNLPKYHFYSVTTVRVRPGHSDDFEALTKLLAAHWEKIGSKQRRVVYGITSGAPGGTYLILSGMETLASMDPPRPAVPPAQSFGDDWARYQKLLSDAVISTENLLYSVSPKMSYPPKEFIEADPDFWAPKPKPAAAAKPAASK
jgi:quinol monooxygenase YgiN